MNILDRYSSAMHSKNLKSEPDTTNSDSDVLGAAGLAAKHSPLAMSLLRLFLGDDRGAPALVEHMTQMLVGKAYRVPIDVDRADCTLIARAVLAWHRDGVCKACGGHGFQLIANTPALSSSKCPSCRGTGRKPFDSQFHYLSHLYLAQWLLAEVERETAKAGPAALVALAPRLDL